MLQVRWPVSVFFGSDVIPVWWIREMDDDVMEILENDDILEQIMISDHNHRILS